MSGYRVMHWSLCCLAVAMAFAGCTSDTTSSETTGSLSLNLEIGNVEIDAVDYLITGDGTVEGGTIDTSAPGSTASVEVFGLLPGDYTVTMSATATDGETTCEGSEDFSVEADELTEIMVYLRCKLPETLGAVRVNGEFNVCAVVKESVVKPLQTSVGNDIDLSAMGEDAEGDEIAYLWTGTGGSIDDPTSMNTTYTCEEVGDHKVTIEVSDDGSDYCKDFWTTVVTCVAGDGLECIDDEDCDKGEVCNDNNQCVPEVECNENEDCDAGEICLENKCLPDVECIDDEDCDTGDICLDNVCRADPDLFCDTGRCVGDTVLRAECVGAFLLCLADEVDEEECIVVSLLICNLPECTEDADCGDDNECTDNVCTAGVCSNPNNDNMCDDGAGTCSAGECVPGGGCEVDGDCASDEVCDAGECVVGDCTGDGDCDDADDCTSDNCVANNCVYPPAAAGTPCGTGGQCTSDDPPVCTEGACTDQTGYCVGGGEPCADSYQCATGTCSTSGNTCNLDVDCGTCSASGNPCSADFMCTGFLETCTANAQTCNGADSCDTSGSNSAFICGPQGSQIKSILTGCGVCGGGLGACPDDCFGVPQNPANGAAACTAGVLLRTPEGACPSGLDSGCLGCYGLSVDCGSAAGPPGGCLNACSNLAPGAIDGPNGCDCIDCITVECDPPFAACAGFGNGAPNGTPNFHQSIVGGPPVCEAVPSPACDN